MGKPHSLLLSPPRMAPVNLFVLQPKRSTRKKMTLEVIEQTFRNLFRSKIPL